MLLLCWVLMILFGIWVKNEGLVWLLTAIVMLILATGRLRVPILILLATLTLILLAYLLGISHIEIPYIGDLGVVNNRLSIPFVGTFRLETHDIQGVYWNNFIKMGSWNLLWVLIVLSLMLGFASLRKPGFRTRRIALSFIIIFLATQVFIFGFTNQGLWADAYTAINRLPLHFVPALLFAVVLILHTVVTRDTGTNAAKEASNGTA